MKRNDIDRREFLKGTGWMLDVAVAGGCAVGGLRGPGTTDRLIGDRVCGDFDSLVAGCAEVG